ncbi:MAG: SMP-30/gluconolactonase/LRE family protein [Thermomicrobiales bacterium]
MTQQTLRSPNHAPISRRTLIKAAAVAATAIIGAATTAGMDLAAAPNNLAGTLTGPAAAPQAGVAVFQATARDAPPNQGTPPSVITNPPRQWGPDAPPTIYPDPDIITVDPSFGPYMLGITAIHRLWTGGRWLEGPAWSSEGNYLLFSDVQGDVEYRLTWDDMRVTKFRDPSFHSNGHTIDSQGREITCQDEFRRVVRWEHDGTMTVIADNYQGKKLNSPNDVVPHPDGSIWFTDPPYGDTLSEGQPDAPGGPANASGRLNPKVGDPFGDSFTRQLPTSVYRWDPSGRVDVVVGEDQLADPNGIAFAPDYKTLYVVSTGKGPGDMGPGGSGVIYAFDVAADGKSVANKRLFTDMMVDGVHCGPDGLRLDVDGNVWASSNAPLGYAGVLVFNPQGTLIGRIRLPEVCANMAFGGPKHNFLLMTASQSIYALQVNTQGAQPG